jgi:hypothetical protein
VAVERVPRVKEDLCALCVLCGDFSANFAVNVPDVQTQIKSKKGRV